MTRGIVTETKLPGLRRIAQGKVRDIYELDGGLLLVTTDRMSAFDCILPGGLPGKGEVLTRLTAFWLGVLAGIVPHHLISTDPEEYPAPARAHREVLRGRSMWVRRAEAIPVECVVRGRLVGSALKEYRAGGAVGGEPLPAGLRPRQVLSPPLFTPAVKATSGHDENVGFTHVVNTVGEANAARLRELSVAIFERAAALAASRGIVLVDTKFEFGFLNGEIILIDEVLTPDSSRFWRAEGLTETSQPYALDKQLIRDYLESLDWNKEPPAPELPPDVLDDARRRYQEAFERLTGTPL